MGGMIAALNFSLMSLMFWFRDRSNPPAKFLAETGMKAGDTVLDYGCGPGSYSLAAAETAGSSGKVYAADILPIAVRKLKKKALKHGFDNIRTILTDCRTGLPDNSIDVILLYDILHDLNPPESVLSELQRVLKPAGTLSVTDHHLQEDDLVARITGTGLFKLAHKGDKVLNFSKV